MMKILNIIWLLSILPLMVPQTQAQTSSKHDIIASASKSSAAPNHQSSNNKSANNQSANNQSASHKTPDEAEEEENSEDEDENQTNQAQADTSYQRFIYRSPEERRDAGLGRQLTNWLKASGVIEYETAKTKLNFQQANSITEHEKPKINMQLALELTLAEQWFAELVFDVEYGKQFNEQNNKYQYHDSSLIDEALLGYEAEQWGVTIGRFNIPFGEYYSHFVTSPLLEFGETRGNSLVIDYSPIDTLELYIFALESEISVQGKDKAFDWGAGAEWQSDDEAFRVNISYLSDISESDEHLLAQRNTSYQDVAAFNANAMLGFEFFEITLETTRALDAFAELAQHVNQPSSTNFELAVFPRENVQIAFRYERSKKFQDQPQKRLGASLTWQAFSHFTLIFDALKGKYKNDYFLIDEFSDEDDDEDEIDPILKDDLSFALQMFYEF